MYIFLTTYCPPITLPQNIIKNTHFSRPYPHLPKLPHNNNIKTQNLGKLYPELQHFKQALPVMLFTFRKYDIDLNG